MRAIIRQNKLYLLLVIPEIFRILLPLKSSVFDSEAIKQQNTHFSQYIDSNFILRILKMLDSFFDEIPAKFFF